MSPAASDASRPLRRDAQRNRDTLLDEAKHAFATSGLDVSLEGIARAAGVAIGTLYRHFPTRFDLVEAVFIDKLGEWVTVGEEALAMDDAWEGFVHYAQRMCELQAGDRGFNDLASIRYPESSCVERHRELIYGQTREIVERAQRDGRLRTDITPEDLAFLVWSHGRIAEATADVAPQAWRRHLGLLLDAFRAEGAHPLPAPPMRPAEVYRAMIDLGRTKPKVS